MQRGFESGHHPQSPWTRHGHWVGLQFLREMPELSPISIRVLERMELATTAFTELVRSVEHYRDAYEVQYDIPRPEPVGATQA